MEYFASQVGKMVPEHVCLYEPAIDMSPNPARTSGINVAEILVCRVCGKTKSLVEATSTRSNHGF